MKNNRNEVQYIVLSETAITVNFGSRIDQAVHERVKSLVHVLQHHPFIGFQEYVPSYIGVTVFYHPFAVKEEMISRNAVNQSIAKFVISELEKRVVMAENNENIQQGKKVIIPVCYEDEFGPDINDVAKHNGLTSKEVISIHSSQEYLVYMIGFAPGFPFLGGMNKQIATPRRSEPRVRIAPGSVGIAGEQTGVYPIETPGGWQIIGRTPVKLFDPYKENPSLLQAGDIVRFQPISLSQFQEMKEGV